MKQLKYAKFFLFRPSHCHCHVPYLSRDHLLIRSRAGFSNVYLVAKATSVPAIIKSEMIFLKS